MGVALQTRKRPILLGLGALVLLYGAYQIARVSLDGQSPQASAVHVEPGAALAPEPNVKAPASAAAIVAPAQERRRLGSGRRR